MTKPLNQNQLIVLHFVRRFPHEGTKYLPLHICTSILHGSQNLWYNILNQLHQDGYISLFSASDRNLVTLTNKGFLALAELEKHLHFEATPLLLEHIANMQRFSTPEQIVTGSNDSKMQKYWNSYIDRLVSGGFVDVLDDKFYVTKLGLLYL